MAPSPTPNISASLPTSKLSESSPTTWLERINFFRSGSGLDPIRENSRLSAGATAHARYLLLNFGEDIRSANPMSAEAYEEKPGKSGYSANGASAARNLQLAWGCNSYDAGQQINHSIEGPFHRLAMLDPFMTEAGFGKASSDTDAGSPRCDCRHSRKREAVCARDRISTRRCGCVTGLDWPRGARSARELPRLREASGASNHAANRAAGGHETLRAFVDGRRQTD